MEGDNATRYLQQHLAANVRRRREKLGLSQEAFAEHAAIDLRFYKHVEAAERDVALSTLVRLARALSCNPAALLRPTRPVVRKPGRPKKRN